ncbi:predicted protein [Sclerotinia sclerotiorum 1980 UF-70]|uniref:Uncharacterized protein n=1 Tax=Sclerotinia sclerotiorum (strain ATCC 18683 / 1980 / Ss-1) TaxID=665079 RepID=A7EP13_SCLS1|nr:predicted protein [Sclerotinia sclerotiorum 1980 UF-70]EDO04579.1 predicted protein [Sclerotinia sclerotiorum 1980 UF-70]
MQPQGRTMQNQPPCYLDFVTPEFYRSTKSTRTHDIKELLFESRMLRELPESLWLHRMSY